MKILFAICVFFCMTTIPAVAEQVPKSYAGSVLSEDVTWSGTIVVKGSVVVAPQATLRIEPGAVVRFAPSSAGQVPNLVVQGRLHAAGTADHPITFTSEQFSPSRGSWGGIILLSTEKRNLIERCRIEYAETGIDLRFSSITLKAVTIAKSGTALLSHDGVIQMTGSTVSDAETGIELYNSEFDSRDLTVDSCQRGLLVKKSAVVLASPKIVNCRQAGVEAEECRIKISGGEFAENTFGAIITGGEGQISMARFQRNRQTALHLSGSRVRIQRCLFAGNNQDALRVEDGRSLLLNNVFDSNGGFNLYNAGRDTVSARQNWWGTTEQSRIGQKIYDAAHDKNLGIVHIFPWLHERPQLVP